MWKAGRWIRNFLQGKKDEKTVDNFSAPLVSELQTDPLPIPAKDKKRWSFRRSIGAGKSMHSPELSISGPVSRDAEVDPKRNAMAIAVATAAAADAAVAAAQAAATVMRLTAAANKQNSSVEQAAATTIQAVFRGYLARKALCALRGIVKLQALVRGHLVRKQAAETLRCMQALVSAQARIRAQRIHMIEEAKSITHRQSSYGRSSQHPRYRQQYEIDRNAEENVKIVEIDMGASRSNTKSRRSHSVANSEMKDARFLEYYANNNATPKPEQYPQFSPARSAFTDLSPRAHSGYYEDFSFMTAQSSPYFSAVSVPDPAHSSNDYGFSPGYMANTQSSRAKARSQSAPKQRTDTYERQTSRKKQSSEARNIPIGVKMQRSSSNVGLIPNGYPRSIKLDKSNASHKDSECGSTSTLMANDDYCRTLVEFDDRYYQ